MTDPVEIARRARIGAGVELRAQRLRADYARQWRAEQVPARPAAHQCDRHERDIEALIALVFELSVALEAGAP